MLHLRAVEKMDSTPRACQAASPQKEARKQTVSCVTRIQVPDSFRFFIKNPPHVALRNEWPKDCSPSGQRDFEESQTMSILKNRWTLPLAASALILIPQMSRADAPDPHDLSYEEIKSVVADFGAEVNAARGTVTLKGFIYRECLKELEVRKDLGTPGRADYIIRDMGSLKSCVSEQKKRFPNERFGNDKVFARLSQLPESVIDSEGKDLEVGLGWENTEVDPPRKESKSFPQPIRFVSKASQDREERKQEQLDFQRQLEQCEDVARNSRGTEQKEVEALSALNILVRHGRIDDSDAENLRLDISQERLKRLRERIAKANPEELAEIDRELSTWANRHAGSDQKQQDTIAQLRMDLAEKMSRAAPGSVETNELALGVMQELAESPGLSKSKQESAQIKVEMLKGNVVAAQVISSTLAQAGTLPMGAHPAQIHSAISSQQEFQGFVQALQREMMDSCTSAQRSRGKDKSSVQRCQQAQASLAREPQRVLQIASAEVLKGLAALAPQPSPQTQQPGQQQAPGVMPVQGSLPPLVPFQR